VYVPAVFWCPSIVVNNCTNLLGSESGWQSVIVHVTLLLLQIGTQLLQSACKMFQHGQHQSVTARVVSMLHFHHQHLYSVLHVL